MLKKLAKRFWKDEQGLELSEYAIMIALILAVALIIISAVGVNISRIFGLLNSALSSVV